MVLGFFLLLYFGQHMFIVALVFTMQAFIYKELVLIAVRWNIER